MATAVRALVAALIDMAVCFVTSLGYVVAEWLDRRVLHGDSLLEAIETMRRSGR